MSLAFDLFDSLGEVKTKEQSFVDVISSYTRDNPWWYNGLPAEAFDEVAKRIGAIAPETLGYDQPAVVAGLIKAFKLTSAEHDNVLSLIGCSRDGENGEGLKVTEHQKFWEFVLTVSRTNLADDNECTQTLTHPAMLFLNSHERQEGAVSGYKWVLTDPGTDPNSDDEKSIQFLEKARHLLGLWPHVLYIITAKGSLNERQARVTPILQDGAKCIIYDTSRSNRFFAPPAFSWACEEQPVFSFEEVLAISNEYGEVPDHVCIIGQLCPDFALRFKQHLDSQNARVRVVSYQGPGFNQLGTDVPGVIHPMGESVTWCKSSGACRVTTEMLDASFAALTKDSPQAASYRAKQIFVFLHTNTAQYFQNMFKGFSYVEHYVPIMTEVLQMYSCQQEQSTSC